MVDWHFGSLPCAHSGLNSACSLHYAERVGLGSNAVESACVAELAVACTADAVADAGIQPVDQLEGNDLAAAGCAECVAPLDFSTVHSIASLE